jgi:hypothetical protein
MKHATEMGSGAMIYIPSFIKTGLSIQKLIGANSQIAWTAYKPALGSRLKSIFKFPLIQHRSHRKCHVNQFF